MSDDEHGCGFHVDRERGHTFELASEFFIVFPEPAIGGVDHACAVLHVFFDDAIGYKLVKFKAWERGDLGREVIIACALASDRRDGENEVSDLGGVFESATLSQEEYTVRHASAEQVHDGRRVGGPDPKVHDGESCVVGCCLHGSTDPLDVAPELLGKLRDIVSKVGEQDMITKPRDGHPGIPREPVLGNIEFGSHLRWSRLWGFWHAQV